MVINCSDVYLKERRQEMPLSTHSPIIYNITNVHYLYDEINIYHLDHYLQQTKVDIDASCNKIYSAIIVYSVT